MCYIINILMLKVYFTAATSYDGELHREYKKIISLLRQARVQILSGEQIVKPALLSQDTRLGKKTIFQREKKLIEAADCIVAETSKPSLGVGGEIVYALTRQKPVLALVLDNHKDKISPMLAGNPSDNLFVEYYNSRKLPFTLRDFLNHVKMLKLRKGKLIVIDGGDGSGKTTQANLLVAYLQKKKIAVMYVDFPQYYTSFHGKTVARFLRGEFGGIDQVSPHLISLAYALDRASIKNEMQKFLSQGGYIIANRYATSSMAHQSAKITDKAKRNELLKWIYELEYKVNKIPKEDIVIYLYVPWEIGLYLTKKKAVRHYLAGENADIHEKDLQYRQAVEKTYLELAKKYKHWEKVDCISENKILPPQKIHEIIVQLLKKKSRF